MKHARGFLLGMLAGVVACYLVVDWRIGAAEAYAQMYATGAQQAFTMLDQCQHPKYNWPRKRL